MMPQGVEHVISFFRRERGIPVNQSMMPQGVEHTINLGEMADNAE